MRETYSQPLDEQDGFVAGVEFARWRWTPSTLDRLDRYQPFLQCPCERSSRRGQKYMAFQEVPAALYCVLQEKVHPNEGTRVVKSLEPNFQEYPTWQMRKDFFQVWITFWNDFRSHEKCLSAMEKSHIISLVDPTPFILEEIFAQKFTHSYQDSSVHTLHA